jgi:hypothetical protein
VEHLGWVFLKQLGCLHIRVVSLATVVMYEEEFGNAYERCFGIDFASFVLLNFI